jgi:hypothetical protein
MSKVVRLTENDLVRLVKKIIKEQTPQPTHVTIKGDPVSFLDNTSESFNTALGVKQLPSCFTRFEHPSGVVGEELDTIIDAMDFPLNNDDIRRLSNWADGDGWPSALGGNYKYLPLKTRSTQVNGLFYPGVESLRVGYNKDEVVETLGKESSNPKLARFRSYLIEAYQYWIDCVNGKEY